MFRFDASQEIGGGHAMRCLTLAQALASHGWECRFAWRDQTLETVPALAGFETDVIRLDGSIADEVPQMKAAKPGGTDVLIIDHYGRDDSFEASCRGWADHVAVLEDLPTRKHDCDILIDPTLGRAPIEYDGLVPNQCRRLTGSEFAVLRPEFAAKRDEALGRRERSSGVSKALISFGMADPDNLSAKALRGIAESEIEIDVDVVLGADAPHRPAVEEAHSALPGNGSVHAFVDDMADLMVNADIAIGGAGSTAWERCCLGLPTLMFVLADNQQDIAEGLDDRGAARSLGRPDSEAHVRLAESLRALHTAPHLLAKMAKAAATICDGQGSVRVTQSIIALSAAA